VRGVARYATGSRGYRVKPAHGDVPRNAFLFHGGDFDGDRISRGKFRVKNNSAGARPNITVIRGINF